MTVLCPVPWLPRLPHRVFSCPGDFAPGLNPAEDLVKHERPGYHMTVTNVPCRSTQTSLLLTFANIIYRQDRRKF